MVHRVSAYVGCAAVEPSAICASGGTTAPSSVMYPSQHIVRKVGIILGRGARSGANIKGCRHPFLGQRCLVRAQERGFPFAAAEAEKINLLVANIAAFQDKKLLVELLLQLSLPLEREIRWADHEHPLSQSAELKFADQ
jgi:hypothetical protein